MSRTLFDMRHTHPAQNRKTMRLHAPALIVPGGGDQSHAVSAARYLAECLPKAEYWDVPVDGQTEERVAPRLLQFLDAIKP